MSDSTIAPPRPADLSRLAGWAGARHGDAVAQRYLVDGTWQERSFDGLGEAAGRVAAGLRACGVRAGDRVALLAQTSPEWTICDLAILELGAIAVPIYPTNATPEIEWVLRDSGASLLILESTEHRAPGPARLDPRRAARAAHRGLDRRGDGAGRAEPRRRAGPRAGRPHRGAAGAGPA
ncbi:AMP-binding protein [Jatrophihabitans sp.]|uniref:AMP-binding protein n=1 Tax=Jatrophihabitans sp. TaxID=1932789 RepID=UPI0030C68400